MSLTFSLQYWIMPFSGRRSTRLNCTCGCAESTPPPSGVRSGVRWGVREVRSPRTWLQTTGTPASTSSLRAFRFMFVTPTDLR